MVYFQTFTPTAMYPNNAQKVTSFENISMKNDQIFFSKKKLKTLTEDLNS